jgi:hypothetical protein
VALALEETATGARRTAAATTIAVVRRHPDEAGMRVVRDMTNTPIGLSGAVNPGRLHLAADRMALEVALETP